MTSDLNYEALMHTLRSIALRAGQEIMAVYDQGGKEVWSKDDDSPLTEADLRADQLIRNELQANFPEIFIWSEESKSEFAPSGDLFFLVDPLDGTKEFIKRNGEFTVNIALIEGVRSVVACVYAPALGELFYAAKGLGSFYEKTGEPAVPLQLKASNSIQEMPLRVIGSRSHGAEELDRWLVQQDRPFELVGVGSSLKFCRVAQGLADVYPRFGLTCQWDTAAGQAVLELAGGYVHNLDGQSLHYGLELPKLNSFFIAGSPAFAQLGK